MRLHRYSITVRIDAICKAHNFSAPYYWIVCPYCIWTLWYEFFVELFVLGYHALSALLLFWYVVIGEFEALSVYLLDEQIVMLNWSTKDLRTHQRFNCRWWNHQSRVTSFTSIYPLLTTFCKIIKFLWCYVI